MLLEPERADEVADLIRPEDFYRPAHRMIYAAVCELRREGREIDPVLVGETLEAKGQLAEVGGYEYLNEVFEAVPHGAHAKSYAEIVREKSLLRQAQFACGDCIRECSAPGVEVEGVIGETESKLHAILERQAGATVSDIKTLLFDTIDRIGQGQASGLPSGYDDIDKLTRGFHGGSLIVLAARPSVGKTALAVRMAVNVAKSGAGVLVFSLEQTAAEISERIISIESHTSVDAMRAPHASDELRDKLLMNASIVSQWPLWIDDAPGRNASTIAACARIYVRRYGVRFVVIDYLQLIQPADIKVQREQQVAQITRQLKLLARTLDVPVLVLAQLNRQVTLRTDKTPQLSDLRESGAIEQDADVVLMLDRPALYAARAEDAQEPQSEAGEAWLYVRKNRNGKTDRVPLFFDGPTMEFRPGAYADDGFGGEYQREYR